MSQSYAWEERVPPNILDAVRHLRDLYEKADWECSQVTKTLCYATLHQDSSIERLDEYLTGLSHLKVAAGRGVSLSFSRTLKQGTPPAIFKAYFDLYCALMGGKVELVFQDLLQIGYTHPVGLNPVDWADAQVKSLTRNQFVSVRNWIRDTCDMQPPGTDVDEAIYWRSWRAPTFLIMKPCKFAEYEESTAWTRQDEAVSLRWLDRFVEDFNLAILARLKQIVGEAKVRVAMTSSEPIITHDKGAELPKHLPFLHSEDYRSITYNGQIYSPTRNQAKIIEVLHGAYSAGHFGASKDRLLAAVESETSDVRSFFKNSPLWKTLVVWGPRGMYRLDL